MLSLAARRTLSRAPRTPLATRSFAADAGDVIGIDLGTTNSCVAISEYRWFTFLFEIYTL